MKPVVRQALLTDRDAIWAFLREAYGELAPYKASERWDWQFAANPFYRGLAGRLPVWVADVDGRIVGQIGGQAVPLQIGEGLVAAAWVVDVMVLAEYRGGGIGHRLYALAAGDVDVLMILNMASATRRIAEKAGSVNLGPVYKLSRWVRLDGDSVYRYLTKRTVNWPKLRRVMEVACTFLLLPRAFSLLMNTALRLRDVVFRAHFQPIHHDIREIQFFGEDVDELWRATRHEYGVICPRDSPYLNWRFRDCPQLKYRCFVARRDGRTKGYVVLRRCEPVELPLGVIVDMFASRKDADAISDLIRHSLAFFREGAASVECATTVPEYKAVLHRLGFFVTQTKHPTCVSRDPGTMKRVESLKDEWFLSKGDHDWDQIELA